MTRQLLPCLDWLSRYSWQDLQGDLVAGVTVGVMVVPQSLTYAPLANLPPQYGLYASYVGELHDTTHSPVILIGNAKRLSVKLPKGSLQ